MVAGWEQDQCLTKALASIRQNPGKGDGEEIVLRRRIGLSEAIHCEYASLRAHQQVVIIRAYDRTRRAGTLQPRGTGS